MLFLGECVKKSATFAIDFTTCTFAHILISYPVMNRSTFRGLTVCIAAISLASCQDYDGGFSESKIKEAAYAKNFAKTFTNVDPTQDWNLATRGSVTVAATPGSEIKIYAKVDGKYKIVGDYENFAGNGSLQFDMQEGTTEILVTDGMNSVFSKVGESVSLMGTRTAYPSGQTVTVASDYKDFDFSYVSAVTDLLTEDADNRGKVTENFSYVSTGTFTIYPIYWNTSSVHTMGVYYKDVSGYHTIPFYDTRVGEELAMKVTTPGTKCTDQLNPWIGAVGKSYPYPTIAKIEDGKMWYEEELECHDSFYKVGDKCAEGLHTITKIVETYSGSGVFDYYYDLDPSEYSEEFCSWNGASSTVGGTCEHGFEITNVNGSEVKHSVTRAKCTHDNSHDWAVGDVCAAGHHITKLHKESWESAYHRYYEGYAEYTGNLKPVVGATCEDGHTIDYVDGSGNGYYDSSFAYDFKSTYVNNGAFSSGQIVGSKGITINLPVGTQFGFYLDVYEGESYNSERTAFESMGTFYHTVYSQADVNKEFAGKTTMSGKTPNAGSGWKGQNAQGTYVFGSTFERTVNGKETKYVCFEDWHLAGPDLQDLVFVIDSETPPVVVDEDAQEWIICGEDLGGTFDLDYNDVVVSIAHVSGKSTAKFTALAAGGTLASYVYFNSTCLGEIHELLGAENAMSGDYRPINVGGSVSRTWSTDLTVSGTFSIATVEGSMDANMGGFMIKVVPQGTASTENNATVTGQTIQNQWVNTSHNVPYVFCVPSTWETEGEKAFFRWPNELVPVSALSGKEPAYSAGTGNNFEAWTGDHNKNQWFKTAVTAKTTGLRK